MRIQVVLLGGFIQRLRIPLFSIFTAHSEEGKKLNGFNCSFAVVSALARHANYSQINLLVISKLLYFVELYHTCSHHIILEDLKAGIEFRVTMGIRSWIKGDLTWPN